MDLILWRHAEAAPRAVDAAAGQAADEAGAEGADARADERRALTAKGIRHAARVGAWLDRQLPEQCRILVSPTVRCIQTADGIGRRYNIHEALAPASSAERILDTCGWPGHRFPVLLVGHQPLLGELASLILAGEKQAWKIRKASVFWIQGDASGDAPPFVRLAVGADLIGKLR